MVRLAGKALQQVLQRRRRRALILDASSTPAAGRLVAMTGVMGRIDAPGEEIPIETETTVDLDTGETLSERRITE